MLCSPKVIQQSRHWFKSFFSFTLYKKKQSTERTSSGKNPFTIPTARHFALRIRVRCLNGSISYFFNWDKKQRIVGKFLNSSELPCGYTTHTCVWIQPDKKGNEDPRIPSLGPQLPPGSPQPDAGNSIPSNGQQHSSNSRPSAKSFPHSFHVPRSEKAWESRYHPAFQQPHLSFLGFVMGFVLKSDCYIARVYWIYTNHSTVTGSPVSREFQFSVLGIRNCLDSTNAASVSLKSNWQLGWQTANYRKTALNEELCKSLICAYV